MEEKRNFDKENNNANPKPQQQIKSKTTVENDQYQKSKSEPPPPYQAAIQSNEIKKQTKEIAAKNANQQLVKPAGRPATLLIVPKYFEDKQNNNNLENQSHTFRNPLQLNVRTTDPEYGCLYSADIKRDYDNNKNNYFSVNGRDKSKEKWGIINQSIDTLNTAYTYHGTSCTSESLLTIGGVTLNQGSHSFDLDSNFSRMVWGSQGTSSTLSAMNGRKPKKRELLNFAHFVHSPRTHTLQQPIRPANNLWFEAQQQVQKAKQTSAKHVELKEQQIKKAEKKEKKKRLGPPPQVRNQASRQMEDPLANRPRTHISEKSKKEKKNEFLLNTAAENEKY